MAYEKFRRDPMVEYKGRKYRQVAKGEFDGKDRRKLEFLDGSKSFWCDGSLVAMTGRDAPTASWVQQQADPETRRGQCAECGQWGPSGENCSGCGGEGSYA